MARTRKISEHDILDAAERVVLREGASGLSIDAVAQEAGVSKSRVVYDHKSKSALLEALIERRLSSEEEHVRAAVDESSHLPHPELFGRILVAEKVPEDIDKAICLVISVAMSNDKNIHDKMNEWTKKDIADMEASKKPKAALIAYLALSGFYCTEYFNFFQWNPEERLAILDGIRAIYTTFPDET